MTDETPALLRVEALCKEFPDGQVNALVDVDFVISAGEHVAIMGPSGSGKSTLLSMLGALDEPTSGTVFFEGVPLASWGSLDQFRAQKLGFVFQSFHLLPTLTALENVQIPMFEISIPRAERVRRARHLLELVSIAQRANHLPAKLSVGERQRVAIARSLANDPLLLLADEPTGNLDSHNAEEILRLFDKLHREEGMTLVVVTHSEEVAQRAQRLVRLRDGRVVEDRQL
jgi:putative ABC transport system ATP-binding protein